jgi:hypothetical protein
MGASDGTASICEGVGDHRGAPERSARTMGASSCTAAQNGPSGVLAYSKHGWSGEAGATPRTGDRGHPRRRLLRANTKDHRPLGPRQ